ncbi:expressed unknown protein [Seminavis robusta]|uniref:Uncharacterized protein n=1 Tax=Seminavis robusta TaxID=568900 RepID=A0A9N8HLP6_9STRA|nr:expressed unknown protein [Seminavis robusta]|eukprot:Sro827_g207920.1 n/a (928) ;mRNA; f:40575-43358
MSRPSFRNKNRNNTPWKTDSASGAASDGSNATGRTITPTSSQEDNNNNNNNNNRMNPAASRRGTGLSKSGSFRFSTRSTDDRKPWLDAGKSPRTFVDEEEGKEHNERRTSTNMRRTTSSEQANVLHAPTLSPKSSSKRKVLTMPSSPLQRKNPFDDASEVVNHAAPNKSFDDLWDESEHAGAADSGTPHAHVLLNEPMISTPKTPASAATASAAAKTPPAALATPSMSTPKQPPQNNSSNNNKTEIDTSRFIKKDVDTSSFGKKKQQVNTPKQQQEENTQVDTSKFIKTGSRAPPNTPIDAVYSVGGAAAAAEEKPRANPIRHRRKSANSTTNNTTTKETKTEKEKSKKTKEAAKEEKKKKKKEAKSPPSKPPPSKGGPPGKGGGPPGKGGPPAAPAIKPASEYKNKDEAIVGLEKQLDRVTFLQKRQFDQLSSLKKMLLSSRAKEKETTKANDKLQKSMDKNEKKMEKLEKQLEQSQTKLKHAEQQSTSSSLSVATPKRNNTAAAVAATAAVTSGVSAAELQEKDDKIAELERKLEEMTRQQEEAQQTKQAEVETQVQEKDAKIAELEQRLQDLDAKDKEISEQADNFRAIYESKMIKKAELISSLHEEIEEMRVQLTTANSSIEQLEEERNYSRAKMAELNDMVSSKGGLSNKEQELIDRAAEISNLTSKLNVAEGKVQDRDSKIYKLEDDVKGVFTLAQQLCDAFVGDDEDKKSQQRLLLESSESPAQSSQLLLMNMMNMLDVLKTKVDVLQKERDDMNAKAADRGIQLAESHIRVDKLRTELRRMRAERERERAGRGGGRGRGPPPNGAGPPPPAARHGSHTAGPDGALPLPPHQGQNSTSPTGGRWLSNGPPPTQNNLRNKSSDNLKGRMVDASERSSNTAPVATTPTQRPSRFMSFLKGNLTQEVGPEPSKDASPPLIVQT